MRILILSKPYSPEPNGVGLYSAGLAEWLASRGHSVDVVCAVPSYPQWKRYEGFPRWGWQRSVENGVTVHRCPVFVPDRVTTATRLMHYSSFAASSFAHTVGLAHRTRPDIVLAIAPTMLAAPVALAAAKASGAKTWLHVQDFEVGAALGTGQLSDQGVAARAAAAFEGTCIRRFDVASSISPAMCAKLGELRGSLASVYEFRNWADIDRVKPQTSSSFRAAWSIDRPHVALYSGSIARKQGIDILIDAARALVHRRDLQFVICGEGPDLGDLRRQAQDLDNVMFRDLQPFDRLGELLALADVHLLPQKAGVADMVLPSKLTNMLASGRPVVATADPGTGLAVEVAGCGILTQPGDATAFAAAIESLVDDPGRREALGREARAVAVERWGRDEILGRLEARLASLAQRRA